ncbi:esterase-like activity of phytase family protein [Neorhizobium sp. NCHU2750]|uniref:esterase-like activity of phytase family protein n=1 Tax=Neorhizobium sp. NCHU2750 TaxID=1825976 RepID=UPI000E764952|nr:hypothetical protein NCHU2750_18770 [Neorhizobium sp. NCHU2750]
MQIFIRYSARALVGLLLSTTAPVLALADQSVTVDGKTFVNKGRVAIGRMPASLRDSMGETFGSGSGMAFDAKSWKRDGDSYSGTLYLLPDRGYNAVGTTDYQSRLNTVSITMTPVAPGAKPAAGDEQSGVKATLKGITMLSDDKGTVMTGLDPDRVRAAAGGMPPLPEAPNGKISLDSEAIIRMADGTMFISDEYGPYIYRFSAEGKLLSATQPPKALLPMRKGEINFSSNNPGPGESKPDPKDPDSGRQNNQGLEGMAMTPDGKFIIAVLQSAARQDGGDSGSTRNNTRALVYDAADPANLKLVHEYAVELPVFTEAKGKTKVAAQSEVLALSDTQFLMLSRDSDNGWGMKGDTSLYRKIDLIDLGGATDIAGTAFDGDKPLAPKGKLDESVKPASSHAFIDINDNVDLGRFGLHNGAPQDRNNLSEKWESMAVVPALDPATPDDYFLFVGNDNDFLTQSGHQVGVDYKAEDGAEVDTMFQVYRVTLPGMKK